MEAKKAVQLVGVVRGTSGIHLASYHGVIPAINASFAVIEQGMCEVPTKRWSGVDFLTTSQASKEVERIVNGMIKQGLKVNHA
jgi:hypothetical protein